MADLVAPNLTVLFNAAFAALGDEVPISDAVTDTTRKSVIARSRWPLVRDALLRSHPWNCAIKRSTLTPDTVAPDWGYQSYFTWPADPYCLRILEIQDVGRPYQIEGRKIAADGTSLGIKFIARIEVDQFDAMLLEASVDALAAELALPLTGEPKLKESFFAAVYGEKGKLSLARTTDGMEGKTRTSRTRPLIDIRRSHGGGAGPIEGQNW